MKKDFSLTIEFVRSATVDEQVAKCLEIRSMLSEWLNDDHELIKWMKENHIGSLFILDEDDEE